MLGVVRDRDAGPHAPLPAVGRDDPGDELHEGRLPRAVRADEYDPLAALDPEVDPRVDRRPSVSLRHGAQIDLDARRGRRLGELEADRLPPARRLDALDLLEPLDPALDLAGLGRLVAEAIDEGLHVGDLALLRLALRLEPLLAERAGPEVALV